MIVSPLTWWSPCGSSSRLGRDSPKWKSRPLYRREKGTIELNSTCNQSRAFGPHIRCDEVAVCGIWMNIREAQGQWFNMNTADIGQQTPTLSQATLLAHFAYLATLMTTRGRGRRCLHMALRIRVLLGPDSHHAPSTAAPAWELITRALLWPWLLSAHEPLLARPRRPPPHTPSAPPPRLPALYCTPPRALLNSSP